MVSTILISISVYAEGWILVQKLLANKKNIYKLNKLSFHDDLLMTKVVQGHWHSPVTVVHRGLHPPRPALWHLAKLHASNTAC
jgi:hypothetical protein